MKKRKIVLIPVARDLGASCLGARLGPSALQLAGLEKSLRSMGHEVFVEERLSNPTNSQEIQNPEAKRLFILESCSLLAELVKESLNKGFFPLIIGGDHSIAVGTVSGLSAQLREKGSNLGLIWFDAHGDMNTPESSLTGNLHGMALAHLAGLGDSDFSHLMGFAPKVKPQNIALIGVRDLDPKESKIIRNSGVQLYTMRDIDERGMAVIIREALVIVNTNTNGFHLSFDLDGCDPSVISGSGTLVPGGVTFREARLLMEYCSEQETFLSLEIVELNPLLDEANSSAQRALLLIRSAL